MNEHSKHSCARKRDGILDGLTLLLSLLRLPLVSCLFSLLSYLFSLPTDFRGLTFRKSLQLQLRKKKKRKKKKRAALCASPAPLWGLGFKALKVGKETKHPGHIPAVVQGGMVFFRSRAGQCDDKPHKAEVVLHHASSIPHLASSSTHQPCQNMGSQAKSAY